MEMQDDSIWTVEEGFWVGGLDHYRSAMHPDCVMAFQEPVGLLAGPEVISTLENAPRWASISMSSRRLITPSSGVLVLAYEAEGRRENGSVYGAYCTSTYVRGSEGWRLVQHQQTPR